MPGFKKWPSPRTLEHLLLGLYLLRGLDMALRPKKLAYSIAGVSSVSADYSPERIIVDNPTDTRSRWSAHQHAGARTRQWVLLELVDEPAIISKSLTIHRLPIDLSSLW
jgi:hypothetical protein